MLTGFGTDTNLSCINWGNELYDRYHDKMLGLDAKMLPDYWGRWFSDIEGRDMKQTDLQVFYQLGASLQDIKKLSVGTIATDTLNYLFIPERWLESFLKETRTQNDAIPLHDSRKAAERLLATIQRVTRPIYNNPNAAGRMTPDDFADLHVGLQSFESEFARECRHLDVFTVTQKGLFNSRLLIEKAEKQFPENLLKVMPQQTIRDLREAGRCLAFEIPTACAFHVCRGTEALMLRYYEVLTGQNWPFPRRDWKNYTDQLAKNGAPRSITDRLDEIRETDRNAYAHPDITISLDDAPVIFNLCSAVIQFMAKEIERLLSASSSSPSA